MYKKIIRFLTVVFLAFNTNALVGDTLYEPNNQPYSGACVGDAFLNALMDDTSVEMTPVYQKNCSVGYSVYTDPTNEIQECKAEVWYCGAGQYLEFSNNGVPSCKDCDMDHWCPAHVPGEVGSMLSVDSPEFCNVGGVSYAADGELTNENKNNWWSTTDNKCYELHVYTWNATLNKCYDKNNNEVPDKNSQLACENAVVETYRWQNGNCYDADNNVVPDVTTSNACKVKCGGFKTIGRCECPEGRSTAASNQYGTGLSKTSINGCAYWVLKPGEQLKKLSDDSFAPAPCDENHYCEGSGSNNKYKYGPSNYTSSMAVCPAKYKTSDNTAEYLEGEYAGKAADGSFRCSYKCDAGYYMHVRSGWKNMYSTCEKCPKGFYCPGATAADVANGLATHEGDPKAYFAPTVYDAATYDLEASKYTGSPNYTNGNPELGLYKCPGNQTTDTTGATSDSFCKDTLRCDKGTYLAAVASLDDVPSDIRDNPNKYLTINTNPVKYAYCASCDTRNSSCPANTTLCKVMSNDGETKEYICKESCNDEDKITSCPSGMCIKNVKRYVNGIVRDDDNKCVPCFCPGGDYLAGDLEQSDDTTEMNDVGGAGRYQCKPQKIEDLYGIEVQPYDDPENHTKPDINIMKTCTNGDPETDNIWSRISCMVNHTCANDEAICNDIIISVKSNSNLPGADACSCPKGYEWNSATRACCSASQGCCGPGYETLVNGSTFVGCRYCGALNQNNFSYCDGYGIRMKCQVGDDGYRSGEACNRCVLGSVPAGNKNRYNEYLGCACDNDLIFIPGPDNPGYDQAIFMDKMHISSADEISAKVASLTNLYGSERNIAFDSNLANDDPAKPQNGPGIYYWSSGENKCALHTHYTYLAFMGIAQNGSRKSYRKPGSKEFWERTFRYNAVHNGTAWIETAEFEVDYTPQAGVDGVDANGKYYGYKFKNADNTRLEVPFEGHAENGMLFSGWCKGKEFCCPAGYKVQNINNNDSSKQVCMSCNGNTTYNSDIYEDCSGALYSEPNAAPKPIDTRRDRTNVTYYAMMIADYYCPEGTYLDNPSTGKCEICPAGYYCPGGFMYYDNRGKNACSNYQIQPARGAKSASACISCGSAVQQVLASSSYDSETQKYTGSYSLNENAYLTQSEWDSEKYGAYEPVVSTITVNIPTKVQQWFDLTPAMPSINISLGDKDLNTYNNESAVTTIDKCGYTCGSNYSAGKYSSKGSYKCDTPCEAGYYCPANGRINDNYYNDLYISRFKLWTEPEEWRKPCPLGLTSGVGAAHCRTQCPERTYLTNVDGACFAKNSTDYRPVYKSRTVEAYGEQNVTVQTLLTKTVCEANPDYEWKTVGSDPLDAIYVCKECYHSGCDAEGKNCSSYNACPGSDNINVWLKFAADPEHHAKGSTYGLNPCGSGRKAGPAPAKVCDASSYDGTLAERSATYNGCPGTDTNCPASAYGTKQCPKGSVAPVGATSITQCKCLSDVARWENGKCYDVNGNEKEGITHEEDCINVSLDGYTPKYRPNDVFKEKGAYLVLDVSRDNDYFCVNTYLTRDITGWQNNKCYDANGTERPDITTQTACEELLQTENGTPNCESVRVVSCEWVSDNIVWRDNKCYDAQNQEIEGVATETACTELLQTTGKYTNCTNKAMTICPEDWDNNIAPSTVEQDDVLARFANDVYGYTDVTKWENGKCYDANGNERTDIVTASACRNQKNRRVSDVLDNVSSVSSIKNIQGVGECSCTEPEAEPEYSIDYLNVIDANWNLSGNPNPASYYASMLEYDPIKLVDPDVYNTGHTFGGWCKYDSLEAANAGKDNCTQECVAADDTGCKVDVQNMENSVVALGAGSTGDKWFYAIWTPITYHVTYKCGGIQKGEPDPVVFGGSYTWKESTNECSEDGYDFGAFECKDSGNEDVSTSAETVNNWAVASDVVCNASNTAHKYTINYEGIDTANELPADRTNPDEYYITSDDIGLYDRERTHYDFGGWCKYDSQNAADTGKDSCETVCEDAVNTKNCKVSKQNDATNSSVIAIKTGSFGDVWFYGIWNAKNYDIKYHLNGGTCANDACGTCVEVDPDTAKCVDDLYNYRTYTVNDGDEHGNIALTAPENLSKNYYNFVGWKDNAELNGNSIAEFAAADGGDRDFYAKWEAKEFKVQLDLNGGTCANGACGTCAEVDPDTAECVDDLYNYRTYTVESEDFYLPLADNDILKKTDNQFMAWCLQGEGIQDCLAAYTTKTVTDAETGVETTVYGRTVPNGIYEDLIFIAQWASTVCPVGYNHREPEDSTVLTDCYAIVSYNANGGTPAPAQIQKHFVDEGTGSKYKLSAEELPNIGQEGYEFGGWYDNDQFAGDAVTTETEFVPVNFGNGILTLDRTLHATWTPHTYNIEFNGNGADGGEAVAAMEDLEYGRTYRLNKNTFERSGFTFKQWCTKLKPEDGSCIGATYSDKASVSNLASGNGDTVTLYAMWTVNSYIVHFDKNADDVDAYGTKADKTCTFDVKCDITNGDDEFRGVDYEFVGWAEGENRHEAVYLPDADSDGKIFIKKAPSNEREVTLFAVWTPVCTDEKYLNVGRYKMCLYQTKRTNPSLVIKLGETPYYANMSPVPSNPDEPGRMMTAGAPQRLHVKHDDKIYDVYDLTTR